jgi:hypothetical protein
MKPVIDKPNVRYDRELRARRVARGLCQYCGKEPLVPGRKAGSGCLDKKKAYARKNPPKKKPVIIGWAVSQ